MSKSADLMAALNSRTESSVVEAIPQIENRLITVNDVEYSLYPQEVMGVHIWPAAHCLACNILQILQSTQSSSACPAGGGWSIELGAGAALPSIVAARYGYRVVATDDDTKTLDLIKRNIKLNALSEDNIVVRSLNWSDSDHIAALHSEFPEKFLTVYGSDIIYAPSDIYPLLQCTLKLMSTDANARLVLTMTGHRFSQLHPTFEARASEYGLRLLQVDCTEGAEVYKDPHLCTTGNERVNIYTYVREASKDLW